MNNVNLQNLILGDSPRIAAAIATGAGWEVWFQVELTMLLRNNGVQAAREVPYPPPNAALHLDILAQDFQGTYAIEIKVESATNAGAAILNGVNADRVKIAQYPAQNPGARWVVGVGYSYTALQAMNAFANVGANAAIYAMQNSVGVLICTV